MTAVHFYVQIFKIVDTQRPKACCTEDKKRQPFDIQNTAANWSLLPSLIVQKRSEYVSSRALLKKGGRKFISKTRLRIGSRLMSLIVEVLFFSNHVFVCVVLSD